MKRQFSFSQRGFTMVEIMLAIAMIVMFFAFTSRFTLNPQQNLTKAERLANKIQGIIQTSEVAVMMGRMKDQVATTGAILTISTATGITWQYASSLSGSFVPPFFDGDTKYKISQIKWYDANMTNSGILTFARIDIAKGRTSFSGGSIGEPAVLLEIQTQYIDKYKKILYDRRTGRIEVSKN